MPASMRFLLTFSGQDAFERTRKAETLLAQTASDDHAVRARLFAITAASRVLTTPDDAADVAAQSVREADAAGDEISRAWSLLSRCVVDVSPRTAEERRAMTDEVLRIARDTGEEEFVSAAYFLHLGALAELGRLVELDLALSETGALMAAFPWLEDERHVAWFRCLRSIIGGQHVDAETRATAALTVAEREGDPDARSVWVSQIAIVRWMQGRVVELEPLFLHARQSAPHEPVWAASLAWMWLQQGRRSAARALLTTLPPIDELPVDRNWLATACILAVVSAELREREIALALSDALRPFDDRLVMIGLGVTCWGTVARPLALLADALGDAEAAIAHYRTAIDVAARAGAHPWLAEAQAELAGLLLRRAGDGADDEAAELAAEALAAARALRLRGVEETAAAVRASAPVTGRTSGTAMAGTDAAPVNATVAGRAAVRVLGRFEVVSKDGTVARWQSRKARQLLQILVARRGVAVSRESVMHLLWPDEAPDRLGNRFSVAVRTVRSALDPEALLARDAHLESHGGLVRLCIENLDVDVEIFLTRAREALESVATQDERRALLVNALAAYQGDPLVGEPEALWAQELQRDVHIAYFAVAHELADLAQTVGDQLTRVDCYRGILDLDPYDQRAHEGLIHALEAVRATGQLRDAQVTYAQRMRELGIAVPAHASVSVSGSG